MDLTSNVIWICRLVPAAFSEEFLTTTETEPFTICWTVTIWPHFRKHLRHLLWLACKLRKADKASDAEAPKGQVFGKEPRQKSLWNLGNCLDTPDPHGKYKNLQEYHIVVVNCYAAYRWDSRPHEVNGLEVYVDRGKQRRNLQLLEKLTDLSGQMGWNQHVLNRLI